jgi:beta-galactosidase
MRNIIVLIFFGSLFSFSLNAQQERLSMNKGWSFKYISPDSKERDSVLSNYFYKNAHWETIGWTNDELMSVSYNDSTWREVNVPHDFVIENVPLKGMSDIYHGSLETGIGMYRKLFDLNESDKGKRIWIRFEGVYRDAQVFLNGFKLLEHHSGYTPFRIDISDVVHYGNQKNILLLVCDSRQSEGWWYEGGGIYRPVYLEKSGGSLYFEPDEIKVNPILSPDYNSANVDVYYTVQNRERKSRKFEILSKITDKEGKEVNSSSAIFVVEPWAKIDCRMAVKINSPKLWSLEERNMYYVESEIKESGLSVEKNKTRFGIRSIVFDAEKGLYLNGKHVKVMGASVHQDNGSVGVAVPAEIIRYRIQNLKNYGFNGYRSAHNAASPALLDICDEEGMLVVNEQRIPETSSEYLEEMREIIRDSRNHPSVFLYNLANEEKQIMADPIFEEGLASTLMQEIARLDPQKRAATMNRIFNKPGEFWPSEKGGIGLNEYLKRAHSGAGRVLDVAGFSYNDFIMYAYEGNGQPIIQVESGGNIGTRGVYETNEDKLWVSSIPPAKVDERVKNFMRTDRILGAFVWIGFDFRGEPKPYSFFPAVSTNKGLFDLCGFPKDPVYYYKAVQSKEPVLHLFPHWNWKGREGEIIKVFTYTNLEEVELFQDRKSLGRQNVLPFENQSWDVKYKPGTLTAKGYMNHKLVLTDEVKTSGEPSSIKISAYKNILKADGEDAVTIKFEVLDKKGIICPNADNIINITIEGNGHLLGVDNGNPTNINPAKLPKVRAFNGLCSAIIQSNEESGSIIITANSEGLKTGVMEVKTIPVEIKPAVKSDLVIKDYMFFRKPGNWNFK